jgi:GTPase SAR1 family protein
LLDEKIDTIRTSKDECVYFKPDDEFKRQVLGISSHFEYSINKGSVDETSFWFNDYLQDSSIDEDNRSVAKMDVFFRFKRRTECIIPEHFSDSEMYEYQVTSGGRATHLVEQVVYGAEFIVSMRRAVDRNETKENAEKSLRIAAKAYFDEAVGPNSNEMNEQPPVELNNVICTNFCSLSEHRMVKKQCSIRESCEWLRETIGLDEEIDGMKWQAIEIVLRNIPDQIGARLFLDMKNEFSIEKKRSRTQFFRIQEESSQISKCSSFDLVPQSIIMMKEFLKLLPELEKKFNLFNETDFLKLEFPENVLSEIKEMTILFADIIEWLLKREKDIGKIRSLLKDTQKSMLDLSEIEGLRPSGNYGSMQVLSQKESSQDPLLKRIKKFIQNQDSSVSVHVSLNLAVSENRRGHYLKELPPYSYPANGSEIQFGKSNHINQKQSQPLNKTDYSIPRLSQSNQRPKNVDEDVKITGPIESQQFTKEQYAAVNSGDTKDVKKVPNNGSQIKTEYFEQKLTEQSSDQVDSLIENFNVLHIEVQSDTTTKQDCHLEENLQRKSKETSETVADRIGNGQFSKFKGNLDNNIFSQADTRSLQTNSAIACSSTHQDENLNVVQGQTLRIAIDCNTVDQGSEPNQQIVPEKKKITEVFTQEEFAKLKKDGQPMVHQAEPARMQIIPSIASSLSRQQEESAIVVQDQGSTVAIDSNTMDQRSKPIKRSIPDAEKKKITELFTQEEFAKLIKVDQPMVYQLNTKERSVGENLRYFDIPGTDTASSSQNSQNRKVIILMGATGSGKSTLINGMINYILGVQWKDPFRFKCVREDSSVVRNEAHSQTDSVTAYTLHHREGMAIPYSITLIDTPGYGDTRGIERDKKITGCIHRFLTQQQGFKIDQIHAIGFVAASADSRLTPTQRYVLDSVLSIFGEDVKENIRLLVTFADNAIPPVVEACRAAHFPMTSPSDDVMYNKFNSSVLYASNDKKNERIKETMWNMGQRNYKTFFTTLESMNGCDLKSTRQVIENRQLLEHSLLGIEVELDVCFDTIEKLENRSLHENSSARKLTNTQKSFELGTAKAKVISLLNKVNKSGRVLDSVALRSHSSSAADYLSLIRSRVIEEQKPGCQIRLQTLTELQNLQKGNAKTEVPRSQTTHQSSNSRLNAALTNEISGYSGQRTNVGRRNSEDVVAGDAFQQSTAGATDTKIIQSTETMPSSSASYDKTKHIKNPRGGAEGPSNMENPMQPCSANNEDVKKPTDFSSQSSSDPAECGSCRII